MNCWKVGCDSVVPSLGTSICLLSTSAHDDIIVLGKAHTCSAMSLSHPQMVDLEKVPMQVLPKTDHSWPGVAQSVISLPHSSFLQGISAVACPCLKVPWTSQHAYCAKQLTLLFLQTPISSSRALCLIRLLCVFVFLTLSLSACLLCQAVDTAVFSNSHFFFTGLVFNSFIVCVCFLDRYNTAKELISHDSHNNTYNYKYTYSVEIVPLCKDNIICLPRKVAQQLGNISPLCVCHRVTQTIHLIDPATLQCMFVLFVTVGIILWVTCLGESGQDGLDSSGPQLTPSPPSPPPPPPPLLLTALMA